MGFFLDKGIKNKILHIIQQNRWEIWKVTLKCRGLTHISGNLDRKSFRRKENAAEKYKDGFAKNGRKIVLKKVFFYKKKTLENEKQCFLYPELLFLQAGSHFSTKKTK